ncbi:MULTISPECIES: alpha/beta fold hydrolase [Streptomyces]|uniref:alpha/beta fold hydrolase n=1 Tax=Streptomyces TaxID=1883 RepID=UPI0006EB3ADE|nr:MULTISPECIES: alpha/beta hydrolase [Streptomyces]
MPTFSAYDGTELAYHEKGDGEPLLCVPGGPMRASAYLGDLGGLTAHRRLVLLDLRGTGDSAAPADPATYRCDRLVDDVEALREHLGLDEIDLLGHSASGNIATLYAARHPKRVRTLVLVTPSTHSVGLTVTDEDHRAAAALRADEPWFPAAEAALKEIAAGRGPAEVWDALAPLAYGRWDAAARAHRAASAREKNAEAAAAFYGEGAFDPPATRAALTALDAPVLVLAGEWDGGPNPAHAEEFAGLFPRGVRQVQPRGGHFPWLDDPEWFARRVAGFLAQD